jgi:single-strand DNA-binding protein
MQKDTNSSVFTGRLTKDPELEKTPNDKSVCTLRVAIQRRPGADGEDRGAAFYDVETWGSLAELCARFLKKGRRIAVTGRLEHDEWGAKGAKRQRNYIVADEVNFIDAPPENGSAAEPTEATPEPAAAAA